MEFFTVNFDGKLCVLHPKVRNSFLPDTVNSKCQLRYGFYTFSYPGWSVIQINLSPRIKLESRWWTMRRLRGVMGWREGVLRWSREKLKMAAGVKVRNGMRNNQDVCVVGWRDDWVVPWREVLLNPGEPLSTRSFISLSNVSFWNNWSFKCTPKLP